MVTRAVCEEDLRLPEFRDAKLDDLEFREDGKIVRKDRWEQAVRKIVGIFEDMPGSSDFTSISRREFEIEDVIKAVQTLVGLQDMTCVASVHPGHFREREDHWCREVLMYSPRNPGDRPETRVPLYARTRDLPRGTR